MDHLKIEKSHFVGISLGTILIRQLAEMQPERVEKDDYGRCGIGVEFEIQTTNVLRQCHKICSTIYVVVSFFCFYHNA